MALSRIRRTPNCSLLPTKQELLLTKLLLHNCFYSIWWHRDSGS